MFLITELDVGVDAKTGLVFNTHIILEITWHCIISFSYNLGGFKGLFILELLATVQQKTPQLKNILSAINQGGISGTCIEGYIKITNTSKKNKNTINLLKYLQLKCRKSKKACGFNQTLACTVTVPKNLCIQTG